MPDPDSLVKRYQRVAVVGAGLSGLTAAKCLGEEGIEPVVFEQSAEIGGLWNYHEEAPDGGGPAYRSLKTNTSKEILALSDHPFPQNTPDFPPRAAVLEYLHSYAERFDLRRWIRLNMTVEAVDPVNGGWEVSARSGDQLTRDRFDAVIVGSGRCRTPHFPDLPGSECYQGIISHSLSYKGPESYAGRDVLIIGAGSSGADIAVEVSQAARRVYVSMTKGVWFAPLYMDGRPFDHRLTSRFTSRLSKLLPEPLRKRFFQRMLQREYRRLGIDGRLETWGLTTPGLDSRVDRVTSTSTFLLCVARNAIQIKPSVARLETNGVVFADGSSAPVDTIICCTGYRLCFPFLRETLLKVDGHGAALYKHIFHPDQPSLAFSGMCKVGGAVFTLVEMQARWVARVFSGKAALPAPAQMRREIEQRRTGLLKLGGDPMRVQPAAYLDELAGLIGARPKLIRHPQLIWQLLTGPLVASQYRLDGPGRWPGAESVIRRIK